MENHNMITWEWKDDVMTEPTVIQIVISDFSIDVTTDREITPYIVQRIEKNLNIILNGNVAHDLRGRVSSINISLSMLERSIPPESERRFQMLKLQIEDLSRLIEAYSA